MRSAPLTRPLQAAGIDQAIMGRKRTLTQGRRAKALP